MVKQYFAVENTNDSAAEFPQYFHIIPTGLLKVFYRNPTGFSKNIYQILPKFLLKFLQDAHRNHTEFPQDSNSFCSISCHITLTVILPNTHQILSEFPDCFHRTFTRIPGLSMYFNTTFRLLPLKSQDSHKNPRISIGMLEPSLEYQQSHWNIRILTGIPVKPESQY